MHLSSSWAGDWLGIGGCRYWRDGGGVYHIRWQSLAVVGEQAGGVAAMWFVSGEAAAIEAWEAGETACDEHETLWSVCHLWQRRPHYRGLSVPLHDSHVDVVRRRLRTLPCSTVWRLAESGLRVDLLEADQCTETCRKHSGASSGTTSRCTGSVCVSCSFFLLAVPTVQGGAKVLGSCWLLWVNTVSDISQGNVVTCLRCGGIENQSAFDKVMYKSLVTFF